ncbi:MAG TPA: hypothetical protein VGN18_18750 [Jatrophihabitans sp.]|jgi:hypothetical protein|uniref:hypothetical protein n=1 Tax=Jatrophihabitans sp. TaxID=1932789 RepID=UPI002DFF80DC|nr:hypothetical protein [Jatrophihabitans sp.]
MATVPRDLSDLYLAPVVLALDERIREYSALDPVELAKRVELESDRLDWSRDERETAILMALSHLIDLHGWALDWVERGVQLSRGSNSVVLGVPQRLRDYVDGDRRPART